METLKGFVYRYSGKTFLIDSPEDLLKQEPSALLAQAQKESYGDFKWGINRPGQGRLKTELPFSRELPSQLVDQLGIQVGDDVVYEVSQLEGCMYLCEINGRPLVPTHPITSLLADYPSRAWPVDSFGFPSLRVATGQAPLGLGSNAYLQGPGGSGKTSLQFELVEAMARLTTHQPMKVIIYSVGERNKDAGIYTQILGYAPHRAEDVELYVASVGIVNSARQWALFEYLIERARALARHWNVVLLVDSLHPLVEAHSSNFASTSGGMFSGGLYTESLYEVREKVSITGNFGATSLTIVSAMLGNAANNVSGGLDELAKRTADNVPDVLWSLVQNPGLEYPRVDVDRTKFLSRRQETFADPRLVQEQKALYELMWERDDRGKPRNKAEEAHAIMVAWYMSRLIPEWAAYPPSAPILPYHLTLLNQNQRLASRLAHLVSEEDTEAVMHLCSSRGITPEQLMQNALTLYMRTLQAQSRGERVFLGKKPGDLSFEVDVLPRVSPKPLT